MNGPDWKTFWTVVGAIALLGITGFGFLWREVANHVYMPYHLGMPFYVEQRITANTGALTESLEGLRKDIQALREALLKADIDPDGVRRPMTGATQ